MKAQEIITKLSSKFETEKSGNAAYVALDNTELRNILNGSSAVVRDIMEQETWIMDDSSYITRNADEYWIGGDVDDFLITEEIEKK